jgi:DNA repair protein RecO (recombination protein O)
VVSGWSGPGLALAARRYGENDTVLELFTPDKGRLAGLVYGGAGSRKRGLQQPGTRVSAAWTARGDDALGWFETLEADGPGPAALMDDPAGLAALSHVTALLHEALPERAAYPALWAATEVLLEALQGDPGWPAVLVRWEVGLLAETGYGLDLSGCALGGAADDLAWVSPRTGRAASRAAGAAYADRLLALPGFLAGSQTAVMPGDVADGLALTGHFL